MQLIKKTIKNLSYIFAGGFNLALILVSLVGTFFTLFNPSENVVNKSERAFILIMCVVVAVFGYFIRVLICRKTTVFEEDEKRITVQYGDLLGSIRKCEAKAKNAIFVIPVNRCFDTIVDDVVVEKGSVHGQFVDYVTKELFPLEVLDEKIETTLKPYRFEVLSDSIKDKGKVQRYPVGTVAKIESVKGNIFYLVGLTAFVKKEDKILVDNAISFHDYLECLQKLVDYYNDDGRNLPIYIPTIGCGLARLGITIDDAIRQIVCIWKMNKKVIRNSVNIVVYKKNFWNVHIMDYK